MQRPFYDEMFSNAEDVLPEGYEGELMLRLTLARPSDNVTTKLSPMLTKTIFRYRSPLGEKRCVISNQDHLSGEVSDRNQSSPGLYSHQHKRSELGSVLDLESEPNRAGVNSPSTFAFILWNTVMEMQLLPIKTSRLLSTECRLLLCSARQSLTMSVDALFAIFFPFFLPHWHLVTRLAQLSLLGEGWVVGVGGFKRPCQEPHNISVMRQRKKNKKKTNSLRRQMLTMQRCRWLIELFTHGSFWTACQIPQGRHYREHLQSDQVAGEMQEYIEWIPCRG